MLCAHDFLALGRGMRRRVDDTGTLLHKHIFPQPM